MKKKLIALLLAVMMVVSLLPATVISAMDLASAGESVSGNAGATTGNDAASGDAAEQAETPIVDDDTEVFEDDRPVITDEPTEEHYFAIVNPNGDVVGYYATLLDADNAVEEGDTIKQLKDYTITSTVTLGNGRNKYSSDPKTGATSELPLAYTIDGNGYKIIANLPVGEKGADGKPIVYNAIQCKENSDSDELTFKNMFVISSAGGIVLYLGTGKGMHAIFEDCKIYSGGSYWYADPNFYKGSAYDTDGDGKPEFGGEMGKGMGIDVSTVNTYVTIKGKDTVIMTYSWEAVKSAGITEIYDGYFHALDGYQTVWEYIADPGTSGAKEHKMMIYGGTFINEKRACVLVTANAQAFIHGGTFIQTAKNKNADATCVMSGWSNGGHAYVTGGTFWLNWLATSGNPAPVYVQNTTAAATVLGGEFYYTSVDRPVSGVDGSSFKLGTYSELVGEVVNLETLTVPTLTGDKLITANFHATVESTVTPEMIAPEAIAPDKNGNVAEVVIYDKAGNIVTALDVDTDTTNGIWSYLRDGAIEYTSYATVLDEWARSFYLVPEGGTYSLHADLETGGAGVMCQDMGQVTFTVQGNGHTVDAKNNNYFCYAEGGNITFLNITMKNSLGRGIQIGFNFHNRHTWTLGEGAKVYAQSGSAAYIKFYGVLIMEDGSEMKSDDTGPRQENNALIQLPYSGSFIMNGGKLDHTSRTANYDEKGFLKDDAQGDFEQIIRVWRFNDDSHCDGKRVWYMMDNPTLHLLGGEIQTTHGVAHLLRRQTNETVVDFKVGDVTFTYHEWNPATEQIEKKSFTAKEQDSVNLLDENGQLLCVFDSIDEALPYVKDGYTVQLNTNVVELHPLRLNLENVSWTLDFNGYSYCYYASGEYVIYIHGTNQNLLMKNGDVHSHCNSMEIGTGDDIFQDVVFENMGVFAGGTSRVNDVGIGSVNSCFYVRGYNTHVTFIGEDTAVRSSRRTAIYNQGAMLEIYDGEFTTHSGYNVIDSRAQTKPATNSNVRTKGQTTIYNGTFISGGFTTVDQDKYSCNVIRSLYGSTVYIVDGTFIYRSVTSPDNKLGETNLLRGNAESTNGYMYVLGGTFYSAHESRPIYGGGAPALAFIRYFGGTFYSVAPSEIKSKKEGDKTQDHHTNFTSYYGSFYDEFYTPVNEQGTYVFDANSGVHPAAQNITYNYKSTLTYDTDFITTTWGNVYNGEKALRVSYGYTTSEGDTVTRTRDLHGFELEAAVWSVGNKGAVTLLADTEWNNYKHTTASTFPTTSDVNDYAIVLKIQHQNFEWTLNSAAPEGEYYTLKGNANGKYIFFTKGGIFNIENMTLQNIKGRVIQMDDWQNNKTVVNVQNGGEVSGFSECTIYLPDLQNELNIRDDGYVNVVDSALYGDGGGWRTIKHMGHKDKSVVNIYDGGYVNYGRDGEPQAGGLTRGDAKGWIAISLTDKPSRLNVYGGKLYGNYNSTASNDRYATILTWGAAGGRGSEINIYGGDIYSECSYCIYNGQPTTHINIYGGYFHNNISEDIHNTYKAGRVIHSNAGSVTIWGGKFEKENSCGCNTIHLANWANEEQGYHYIYGGEIVGGYDQLSLGDSAKVTIDSVVNPYTGIETVPTFSGATSAVIGANGSAVGLLTINDINIIGNGKQAIYCGDTPIVINGGTFGDASHRTASALNVAHASSSSDITVNGGTYYCSKFLNLNGTGIRNVTVNNDNNTWVDATDVVCYWEKNGSASQVVFNGGYFTDVNSSKDRAIFRDGGAMAINLTVNGGEFYHGGGSRMIKLYSTNITLNINGGYFHNNSTSDLIHVEPAATIYCTISGGEFVNVPAKNIFQLDGAGYVIVREGKDAEGEVTVPKFNTPGSVFRVYSDNASVLIEGGEFTSAGSTLYFDTANDQITHIINGGTFSSTGYCVQTGSKSTTSLVINGGSFSSIKGNAGPDACVSIEGGTCTINAGTFEGNGMCVMRVLGGKVAGEGVIPNAITTVSTAKLIVNGGVFHLLAASGRTSAWDAVVRCGGGSTYGTVILNGGIYINDRECSQQVVFKNNTCSSIEINGGTYLASEHQIYFYNTNGVTSGATQNYSEDVAVASSNYVKTTWGENEYFMLMLTPVSEDAPVMQAGAQVRLDGNKIGLRFVSRISADVVEKYSTMPGVTVSYGTLIAPLDYVMEAGALTVEAFERAGLDKVDIPAKNGMVYNADGSLTIRAVINEIKAENRDMVFAAVAYILIVDEEGNETRVYSAFSNKDNARSVSEVAQKSLNDVKDVYGAHGGVRYIYPSLVHEGMYCRYNAEQQRALMTCIPAYDAE